MMRNMQRPMDAMGRDELKLWIQQLQFTMRDLALYLDTHPEDVNAHRYYLDAQQRWKQALAAYKERFGIQFQEQICDRTEWSAWVSTPWPWEKGDD